MEVLGLPDGPELFLVTTSEGEVVYCSSSEYHSGSRLVNVIIDGLPYQNGRPMYATTILQPGDEASSTSTRTPSREVFMTNAGREEGHHDRETLSQVSADSRTIAGEDTFARDAR